MHTAFTELVGIEIPVQSSPMGGIATPQLAAAVAKAGGLGMIPGQEVPPGVLAAMLDTRPLAVPGAYGVGFLVPYLDRAALAAAASRVSVIDFFFGEPERELVDEVHSYGALASWQAGSLREAAAAERAGCDFVVVQGNEAGGRMRANAPLAELLPLVVANVRIPVVAGGGIGTGEDAAWALRLGAAGVRIGTILAVAEESAAHPAFRAGLVAAAPDETVITGKFAADWPAAPQARVLRSALEAAERFEGAVVAQVTAPGGAVVPVPRFAITPPTSSARGTVEAMAAYAGRSVGAITAVRPAAAILREFRASLELAMTPTLATAS